MDIPETGNRHHRLFQFLRISMAVDRLQRLSVCRLHADLQLDKPEDARFAAVTVSPP